MSIERFEIVFRKESRTFALCINIDVAYAPPKFCG